MRRKPPWWATQSLTLAARVLPRGPIRERYRQEFDAELSAMSRRQAAAYVVGVVASAWRLRTVVMSDVDPAEAAGAEATIPLACRLNLRHRWAIFHTEDGGLFSECARCHKERPQWTYYLWRYPGDNIRGSWGG